jgi:tetratricopeptide (TPR) repeat protein
LRHEQENLVAAHAWCAHAPQGGTLALRLAGASWRYWQYSLQPERGYRLAAAALELAGAEVDSAATCRVLHGMVWHAFKIGRYSDMRLLAERCLAIAQRIGEAELIIDGLRAVGCSLDASGEFSGSIGYYEKAVNLARETGDEVRLGLLLSSLAECERGTGNLAAAESLYREGLHLRDQANHRGRAINLFNLACVFVDTGRPEEARVALTEARSLARLTGQKGLVECATDVAAALASSLDQHETAARLHGAMLRQMKEAGIRHEPIDEAFVSPWIARSRSAMGDGPFEAAQAEGWAMTYAVGVAELDRWLANIGAPRT